KERWIRPVSTEKRQICFIGCISRICARFCFRRRRDHCVHCPAYVCDIVGIVSFVVIGIKSRQGGENGCFVCCVVAAIGEDCVCCCVWVDAAEVQFSRCGGGIA